MPGIKSGLTTYKANTLHTVLLLQPLALFFKKIKLKVVRDKLLGDLT